MRSDKEASTEVGTPYSAVAHSEVRPATLRPNRKCVFMGSHPCCPPSPERRDNSGALFDEVERVVLLKVTALITLDDMYRRSSNRQAAAMMTIQVMEFLARPSVSSSVRI